MNKTLKVMTSAALLAGVVAPVAVTTVDAAGQGTVKVLELNTLPKNIVAGTNISTVSITVNKNQRLTSGDNLIVELPTKFDLTGSSFKATINDTQFNGILDPVISNNTVKLTYNGTDPDPGAGGNTDYAAGVLNLNKDLVITLYVVGSASSAVSGEIKADVIASSNSPFPAVSGAVIATTTSGELQLTTKNTRSSNNRFAFDLRANEAIVGTLRQAGTVRVKLPVGYEWTDLTPDASNVVLGGNGAGIVVTGAAGASDRELVLSFPAYNTTNDRAALIELTGLEFQVSDEKVAKKGDVKATISGSIDTDVKSLIVGKYGDYETVAEVVEMNELLSGKKEQELGKIVLREELPNTWIPGRTITVTLPEYARWDEQQTGDEVEFETTDGVVEFTAADVQFVGTDGRTLKLTIPETNGAGQLNAADDDDPTVVEITGANIYLEPGYAGDVKVDIAGSAGLSAKDVKVATAINPFTMEGLNVSDVIIGDQIQASASLVIKEVVAGAFNDESDSRQVRITLPQGVKVSGTPTVKVTKGDLVIGDIDTDAGVYEESEITFNVLADSTEASEVTIEGLNLTIDRTVPVGDVKAALKGSSVIEFVRDADQINGNDFVTTSWSGSAASAVVSKVITPAPNDTTLGEAVFTIGSTTYSVAGETKSMDVAPFVEAGRTFLPVRYVAEAVGVTPQNILYDNATATVTILKGDRVAQATLGSNILSVNGAKVPMDVKAKTVNDRTVLPVRFVAQALGSEVIWDAASQTATVK